MSFEEVRVLNKTFKEVLTEFPETEGSTTINKIVSDLLPKYGFEITEENVSVKKPVQAVFFGKGKYFNGKFKGCEGLFLCYIGIGFTDSTITVVFKPKVD